MNKKSLYTLEYNKITEQLASLCSSEPGANFALKIKPLSDRERIELMQAETQSAFDRLVHFGPISFGGLINPKDVLTRLEKGAVLTCAELLHMATQLELAKRCVSYGKQLDPERSKDNLTNYFENVVPCDKELNELRRCIVAEDIIADDASQALHSIRRNLELIQDKIKSALNAMVNNQTIRGYLQDALITQRDGRYCLPVRADSKSMVPGLVHDQSSTGSTFFIEPMSVVNLNNEYRELIIHEKEEIERILAQLSQMIYEQHDQITYNYEVMVRLDFIFAKANLAAKMNAFSPKFNTDGITRLIQARHPLLDQNTVVPVDITLGEDYNLLLITGPNTGGKTVSLKTVGLLTLMAQAGLFIPAKEGSVINIFDNVYADIGDEQSIEQSLSTFSSHMTRIVDIIENVSKEGSYLVLFDELCAGTDPKEGAALAMAILDRLHNLDVRTMATTHYSELKMYAMTTKGVENASCEFSLETLSPTYKLIIGIPGKSNAFAISKKLGLGEDLIADAKERLSNDDMSVEDMLLEIETKRLQMERDALETDAKLLEATRKLEEVNKKEARLEAQKEKILEKAKEEANELLQEAKDLADSTIRDFNKYGSKVAVDVSEMERKRMNLGNQIKKNASKKSEDEVIKPKKQLKPEEVNVGDKVRVVSMNSTGTVCSRPDGRGNLQVMMGIIKSTVNLSDLEKVQEESKYVPKKGGGKAARNYGGLSKAATISPEINLLGCTADEAISKLDKYLDDAYISHLETVRVVHGKGTGVLRKAVQQYLRGHKQVKSYHLGEFGEGDSGVTIVEFK